jgi:CBS domain-containing protein
MKVKDCMCNDVCCVKPETKIQEVAKLMSQNHIGCIPVCDDKNCICGIVTDRDILLRCISCDKDAKQTPVSDIMTCNVCYCEEDDQVTNAETKMSQNQIRRLPVCDENNKVVGILTLGDLAKINKQIGEDSFCTTIENICNCDGAVKNAE